MKWVRGTELSDKDSIWYLIENKNDYPLASITHHNDTKKIRWQIGGGAFGSARSVNHAKKVVEKSVRAG